MAIQTKKLRYLLPAKYFERFEDVFAATRHLSGYADIKRKPALPLEPLTDRELEMLKLLAQGLSNQEISARSQIALLPDRLLKLDPDTEQERYPVTISDALKALIEKVRGQTMKART